MKMARFQTFWIQMRKNKPLDESRKTGQTSKTKMVFYSFRKVKYNYKKKVEENSITLKAQINPLSE
ncbi:hypothetical protein Hanom_Chr07g00588521 [Helianthus anomalus]